MQTPDRKLTITWIIYSFIFTGFQGCEGLLETMPAVMGQRQGDTLDKLAVHRRATYKDKQSYILTHTSVEGSLDNPDRTHTDTRGPVTERTTFLPWDHGANHCTTVSPLIDFIYCG